MAETSNTAPKETPAASLDADPDLFEPAFPANLDDDQSSTSQPNSSVPTSCMKAFDSVYYCYSPFHQARNYYIEGQLDDCRGRLRRFRLCLLARLKPQSEAERIYQREEQRERESKKLDQITPVWEMRTEFLDSVRRAEKQDSSEDNLQEDRKSSWWL